MTTRDHREPRLPEAAEALLDGWPAPPRGALEWEDVATRTMRRVQETTVGSTEDALLSPPLPVEPGDGDLGVLLGDDEAPELARIAREAVEAKAATEARDVAKEMLAVAADTRAHPPVPPPSRIEAGFSVARPRVATPEVVQAVHEAAAHSEMPRPVKSHPKEGNRATPIWLGAGTALALAAAAVLYVSTRSAPAPVASVEASAEAPAAIAAAPGGGAGSAPVAPAAAPSEAPKTLALGDLAAPEAKSAPEARGVRPSAAAPPGKDALAFRVKGGKNTEDKLVLEERPDEEQQVQANAPAQVAKPSTGAATPAQGDVPPEPSLGAVQAAVGSVMTAARSCLAGQEGASRAKIVFSSNGHVLSVAVSGPAAGTPAEGCVRSALMGARVQPFSEPSFSASITVRPP
ncbi:MAG TPA: hypothetical protein VHE30_09660 [Polyangiaceae bacterium]|nr:hypothetical protein [Polyangiaceae bacterium]